MIRNNNIVNEYISEQDFSFQYVTQIDLLLEFLKKREYNNALRIVTRLFCERNTGVVLLLKYRDSMAGYGVLRKLPKKYSFGSRNDYIIGPYFVYSEFRNHGFGFEIVHKISQDFTGRGSIWAYLMSNNIASIKVFIKCRYDYYANMKLEKRRYIATEDATMIKLYKKSIEAGITCVDSQYVVNQALLLNSIQSPGLPLNS